MNCIFAVVIKNTVMKKIFVLVLCALITSCSFTGSQSPGDLTVVDVLGAFEKGTTFEAKDLFTSIDYVVLESKDECLIGKDPHFFLVDNYILSIADKQIFVFERKTGKFVREIGKWGQGPEEYDRTDFMGSVDEKMQTISTFANKGKRIYSLEGNVLDNIALPSMVYETANLPTGEYVGFVPNFSGKENNKLHLFDKRAHIIKSFPNHFSTLPPEGLHFWKPNGWLYKYKNDVFFYELFNDTVFQVTTDSLLPKFKFSQGHYLPPYEYQNRNDFLSQEYFMMKGVYETDRFLFYLYSFEKKLYIFVYDKKDKVGFVNECNENGGGVIVENDFLPFIFSNVSSSNELIGYLDSYSVSEWFSAQGNDSYSISTSLSLLKETKETDNPVVVIAKLKE